MLENYFDYAATTPLHKSVIAAMKPYLEEHFGNASAVHGFGQKTRAAIDQARFQVADFITARPENIIFTGSATESNNLAILGALTAHNVPGHIITTAIEHASVNKSVAFLQKKGWQVTSIKPNTQGSIEAEQIALAITPNTRLVTCMMVNNEIGTIQPIQEISKVITEHNKHTQDKIIFHVDAVQAGPVISIDVTKLQVDSLTLSAHKMYGPKGIGCLYVQNKKKYQPSIHGGGQEWGLRSGTQNTSAIIGFAQACLLVQSQEYQKKLHQLSELQELLFTEIKKAFPQSSCNGSVNNRVATNCNVMIPNTDNQVVLPQLDQLGFAISSGSACNAGAIMSSPVLSSMGYSESEQRASYRITLGLYTTKQSIHDLVMAFVATLKNHQA